MGAWTRPTGRGDELVLVGPAVCPNGHPLRYPNVLITSNTEFASYTCRTDGLVINREHDAEVEWITQGRPGRF